MLLNIKLTSNNSFWKCSVLKWVNWFEELRLTQLFEVHKLRSCYLWFWMINFWIQTIFGLIFFNWISVFKKYGNVNEYVSNNQNYYYSSEIVSNRYHFMIDWLFSVKIFCYIEGNIKINRIYLRSGSYKKFAILYDMR